MKIIGIERKYITIDIGFIFVSEKLFTSESNLLANNNLSPHDATRKHEVQWQHSKLFRVASSKIQLATREIINRQQQHYFRASPMTWTFLASLNF